MSLKSKSQRGYYKNLDNRYVTDKNCFGKQLKSFSLIENDGKPHIYEKDEILGNNKEISWTFNNFFSRIVVELNILKYKDLSVNSVNSEEPLENLIIKYEK